jgi:hypothetical protein
MSLRPKKLAAMDRYQLRTRKLSVSAWTSRSLESYYGCTAAADSQFKQTLEYDVTIFGILWLRDQQYYVNE